MLGSTSTRSYVRTVYPKASIGVGSDLDSTARLRKIRSRPVAIPPGIRLKPLYEPSANGRGRQRVGTEISLHEKVIGTIERLGDRAWRYRSPKKQSTVGSRIMAIEFLIEHAGPSS